MNLVAEKPILGPFAQRLQQEFDTRKSANPRYSLRAFAALLGTDHAVISQILRGRRQPPATRITAWAAKLGLDRELALAYLTASHVPARETLARQEQLRHWAAEALSVLSGTLHFDILRLTHHPGFEPDSRWISRQTGAPIDEVNIAVSRLLRLQLLSLTSGHWHDLANAQTLSEFRRVASARIREMN